LLIRTEITTFYEKSDGICETFQSDPNIDDPELVEYAFVCMCVWMWTCADNGVMNTDMHRSTLCDDLRRDFRLIMVGSSMIVVSCIVGTILSCVFYCTVLHFLPLFDTIK
jgi:hypothetical protein